MGKQIDRTVSGRTFRESAIHWMSTPSERSARFLPAFSAVSLAVQRKLREQIPAIYFTETDRFATTRHAYPVLIYQASRPFRPKTRSDVTYDVLNQSMMASFFRMAKLNLGEILSAVVDRLRMEGRDELVKPYQPHRVAEIIASVQTRSASTSQLYDLLVGESGLISELLRMAGFGNRPPREQVKVSAALFKTWDFHLRRMCAGHDLRYLGPELFDVATAALLAHQQAQREPGPSPEESGTGAEKLLYEANAAEGLGGLGLVEVRDGSLLMTIHESGAVGRIHKLEGLPE